MTLKRKQVIFPVTLFYDGSCPLCLKEIKWLRAHNKKNHLLLVDIKESQFSEIYPQLDAEELDAFLHAELGNGLIVKGVDATVAAWESVGKGWILTPLTWPVFAGFARRLYRWFARRRHWLSSRWAHYAGEVPCKDSRNKVR